MNKINNDRGISLIEIVIALAIMSLLMTAVVSLMSSNTIIFRKTKNDIEVQSQAESTYNAIADSIHSAKSIYAEGYILDGDTEIKFNSDDLPIDASSIQVTDNSTKSFAQGTASLTGSLSFESLDGGAKIKKVYLTKLVILYSTPIDFQKDLSATVTTLADGTKVAQFTGNGTQEVTENLTNPSDPHNGIDLMNDSSLTINASTGLFDLNPKSGSHKAYVADSDYCVVTYEFIDNKIYVSRKYLYNTSLNTYATTDKELLLYSDDLSYAVCKDGVKVPGIVAAFDADNGCVGLEMYFNDENMTYGVNQLIKVRNSFVLKEAK